MTSRCVDEDALLRLLDGELTENEAERLRQHVRACGVCAARSAELERTLRELKAPLLDVDPGAAIERTMRGLPTAAIDVKAVAPRPRIARFGLLGGGLATVLAMSAIVVAPRLFRAPGEDAGTFSARGAPMGTSMARGVGVALYRSEDARNPVSEGARVRPGDAYAVKYRNLFGDPAYLLAFAVDAAGTVHWICPAYLDAKENPISLALAPSTTETLASSAMQFDAPAAGPLRFVAILTTTPLQALEVDRLHGADLSTASLRARWPTADVRELLTVDVDFSP
jgi:Putative zinc-finger